MDPFIISPGPTMSPEGNMDDFFHVEVLKIVYMYCEFIAIHDS